MPIARLLSYSGRIDVINAAMNSQMTHIIIQPLKNVKVNT